MSNDGTTNIANRLRAAAAAIAVGMITTSCASAPGDQATVQCPMTGVWKLDYERSLESMRVKPLLDEFGSDEDSTDERNTALWESFDDEPPMRDPFAAQLLADMAEAEWEFTCDTQTLRGGPEATRTTPYAWRPVTETTVYLRHDDADGREVGYPVFMDEPDCFRMTDFMSSWWWCRIPD